jgi:hypothetical protein
MRSNENNRKPKAVELPDIVYEPIQVVQGDVIATAIAQTLLQLLSRPGQGDLPVIA